jgi:uncharacterized RDD family membrane protein YckC
MSSDPPDSGTSLGSLADKLTIDTPEQTALEFTIAGVGSRFLAIALDTLIQAAVVLVLSIAGIFGVAGLRKFGPAAPLWAVALLILIYFLLYFGYFAFFEILWNGQTPGKRAAGIRVIKDSGRPLTPAESIGRNLMRIVDWLPGLYAVGVVSALLTKQSQRLGDLVAGSLVVREASFGELRPAWQAPQTALPTMSPLGAHRLSPEDHSLVESYLARRNDLEPSIRYRMADEIFRRIQKKLTLPTDQFLSSDKILESLAYERRATGHYV